MDAEQKYINHILEEEIKVLKGYRDFLLIFYNLLETQKAININDYIEMDKRWIKQLKSINKVKKAFSANAFSEIQKTTIEECLHLIKKITQCLDRRMGDLHDDISSLNKKNNRFGLRYNRYNTDTAKPGLIDIKT